MYESEQLIYVWGNAGGTTKLTISSKAKSSVKVTIPITVREPATGIELNKTSATLNVGATTTLTASILPSNSTDDPTVTWKSSNATVASVDATGIVTAKKAGTATITATLKANTSLTATCNITVSDAPVQDWLDVTEVYVVNPNFDGSTNGWVVDYNESTSQNYGFQSSGYTNGDIVISQFVETWRQQNSWYRNSL